MGSQTHLIRSGGDWTGLYQYIAFPMHTINPPGNIGDPDRDNATSELLFDKAATEMIAGGGQMQHGWRVSTHIIPSIFIRGTDATDPAGTAVVRWFLEYKWYNVLSVVPATYEEEYINCTLPAHIGGRPLNLKFDFPEIDGTGKIASSIFQWRLSRIGGDAADTYDDDCILMHFNIRFKQYRLGSDE